MTGPETAIYTALGIVLASFLLDGHKIFIRVCGAFCRWYKSGMYELRPPKIGDIEPQIIKVPLRKRLGLPSFKRVADFFKR